MMTIGNIEKDDDHRYLHYRFFLRSALDKLAPSLAGISIASEFINFVFWPANGNIPVYLHLNFVIQR